MTVYIDTREPPQVIETVKAACDQKGIDATEKKLDTGDMVIGEVAIERKQASDLNSSITDRRIFEQTSNMAKNFERSYVIIEEDPYKQKRGPTNSSIAASLTSISHKKNVHLLYVPDHVQTAKAVAKIAEYVEEDENYLENPEIEKASRKKVDTESMTVHTLCGITGISPEKARVIEEEVAETVDELLSVPEDGFAQVDGIGLTLSQRIHSRLRE